MKSRLVQASKGQLCCGLAAAALAVGMVALSPGLAAARGQHSAQGQGACSGTFKSPGILSGTYDGDVTVTGVCEVNAGPAVVNGNLTIERGGAVIAAFGMNDQTHSGTSSLTVHRSVLVKKAATLLLGCDPESSPCIDDDQNKPTLSSPGTIGGSLNVHHALGVIVHNSGIGGNITQKNGGRAYDCNPHGIFAKFQSPVFSAYEDSWVGGNVTITGYTSCWMGVIRLHIGGNLQLQSNRLADPDAIETESNNIGGNLGCRHNSRVWDSNETSENLFPRDPHPNTVGGVRSGQCVLSSPTTKGGSRGPGPF